jgi:DNA-directed RNA polymerase sigma subunit (sigma70/sigma32)
MAEGGDKGHLTAGPARTAYVLLQRAAGVSLKDLAIELRLTSERVRQIQVRGERLKREAARALPGSCR